MDAITHSSKRDWTTKTIPLVTNIYHSNLLGTYFDASHIDDYVLYYDIDKLYYNCVPLW